MCKIRRVWHKHGHYIGVVRQRWWLPTQKRGHWFGHKYSKIFVSRSQNCNKISTLIKHLPMRVVQFHWNYQLTCIYMSGIVCIASTCFSFYTHDLLNCHKKERVFFSWEFKLYCRYCTRLLRTLGLCLSTEVGIIIRVMEIKRPETIGILLLSPLLKFD